MTDREFMNYLFDELRYGNDDICRKCAYNVSDRKLCKNFKNGRKLETSVCVDGVREYAEREVSDKTADVPRK